MGIIIDLYHGHHTPEEQLNGWGFDGPVLGPFPYYHITYNSTVNIGDEGIMIAGKLVESLPEYDNSGFIPFLGAYYGDMSISSESDMYSSLKERWEKTQEALKITGNDFAKYINDPAEWVKHYVNCKLKGEI